MAVERIPGKRLSRKDACNAGAGRDDDETVPVSNFSAPVLLRRQMVSFIHGLKKQSEMTGKIVCGFFQKTRISRSNFSSRVLPCSQ
jgi:hypothetical protein